MGKRAFYITSQKQKLNTQSSMEAELVAVNNVVVQILWTRYFLERQGFKVKDATVYQDNIPTMLMAKKR